MGFGVVAIILFEAFLSTGGIGTASATLLAHIQNTHHQYNLPTPTAKIAYKANREGVAETFADSDARKSMEVDFLLIEHYDRVIRESRRRPSGTRRR